MLREFERVMSYQIVLNFLFFAVPKNVETWKSHFLTEVHVFLTTRYSLSIAVISICLCVLKELPIFSGVLLKMEVGICKGAWRRAWRYPAYLWSLRWVYAVKNPGGWYTAYTPQYATVFTFLVPAHPGSPGKRAVKRVCVCVPSKQEILIDSKCRLSAATIWQWEPRDPDLYLSTDDCLFRQCWLHVLHYADVDTAVFFRRETSSHSRSQPSLLICCLVTSRLTSGAE